MVIIMLGSKSDTEWANQIGKYLDNFGLRYQLHISSAHKTPKHLQSLLEGYEKLDETKVYICVAGRSNALGGVVDAQVKSPVISCPPPSDEYGGMDILSSLRMPSGVASMTVLEADQAALAAAKILALTDPAVADKIITFQKKIKENIINEDLKIGGKQE